MPDAAGLELIAQELNDAHGDAVPETSFYRDQAAMIVDPEQILEVLRWLRETPGQEYHFLSAVHAADYYPHSPRFGVHYELLNMPRVERIRLKAMLDPPENEDADGLPSLPSCTELYPGADCQEREVYDMFGIEFRGHPDMRRILMPDGYVGWPQRRDFPIGGDPVIFTKDEPTMPGWTQ